MRITAISFQEKAPKACWLAEIIVTFKQIFIEMRTRAHTRASPNLPGKLPARLTPTTDYQALTDTVTRTFTRT